MIFPGLKLWIDPTPRPAPEAMAVDEWLLDQHQELVLRVYRWQGEWGTIGYFDKLHHARAAFPELAWVRRWTGGGTVDHRLDWAYTVVIPAGFSKGGKLGGAKSYQYIHAALAKALEPEGLDVTLACDDGVTGAFTCFDNPVCYDLIDSKGRKLAGAGQRRSRAGMMHQGSVALPLEDDAASRLRAERLADALSGGDWGDVALNAPVEWTQNAVSERYGSRAWNERR